MLKKRIIPVLLLKNGRMVKGKKFSNFKDTGDPNTAVKIYSSQDADELILSSLAYGYQKEIQVQKHQVWRDYNNYKVIYGS